MKFTIDNQQLELALSFSNSSVEILGTDDEGIELEFKGLRKKTAEEFYKVGFHNNRLVVKEKSERNSPILDSILNGDLSKKVVLKIPTRTCLTGSISSLRGDILMGSFRFSGTIKSITGNLKIGAMDSNDLYLQNISGKSRIDFFKGNLRVKTMAGPLYIKDGVFGEVSVKGVSGSVYLGGGFELEGENEVSTLSGSINVDIHRFKGDGVLVLHSMSANPVVQGAYPEGSVEIRKRMPFIKNHPLKSIFPGIKDYVSSIYSASRQGDEVEVEVKSEKEDENIKMILQMLSEGKLTAEETEKLIKALGTSQDQE